MERWRGRLSEVAERLRSAARAGRALHDTGFLSALSPGGVLSAARAVRGVTAGPHLALMLHAANKPEKIALVEGTRRLRYGDLDREINQIAHGLIGLDLRPADRVAIMLPNCAEYIVVQQALARIGATAVQVGYRLKGAEIAYILKNSEPRVVVCHREYLAQMEPALRDAAREGCEIPRSQLVICRAPRAASVPGVRYEDLLAQSPGDTTPNRTSDGGGVIVYTSGTTGKPKGAARRFSRTGMEAVGDFLAKVGAHHSDRHLVVCPLYHSAAPAFANMMFALGGTVVLSEFEPESILELISRERITSAFMVPTMLIRLSAVPDPVRDRYDMSSLRWICSGAAPLATDTARRFQESFGKVLYNFYGSTETGLVTLAGPEDHAAHPGTVGRLLSGNEVRILDESGAEVAPGEIGELYARNSMLISGYHNDDQATQDSMRDGFFSVGDLARRDADGFYYLESRKHDMVISGGVNIYPREIEDHLHTHADILEAAVIGVPDDEWGEALKAFVVLRDGSVVTSDDVIRFCGEGLADYKRPRSVEFLRALPHNPTGKVLKRELRSR